MELNVTKPIALWNKPLKVDFRELFKALGKGVVDGVSGNWGGLAGDVVDASAALGLDDKPEQVAWLLIFRSLKRAIVLLVQDNTAVFLKMRYNQFNRYTPQIHESISCRISPKNS